ncbi:uncharacterized protein ACBR49_016565 [Aulostomus maculatus]
MAAALLLLVCAGALLSSAEAQDLNRDLAENYKKGVDLALEQLGSFAAVQHHFRYLRSVEKTESESGFGVGFYFHHFHLKPTRCPKGTNETDPQKCPFRNDRPLMDCAVCFKTYEGAIIPDPKPYVHCIQKPRFTEAMKTTRKEHCSKMDYRTGEATLMTVRA